MTMQAQSTPKNRPAAEQAILNAIKAGNRRHGPVSKASNLGTSAGYRMIEKLRRDGKIHQAKNGILTIVESSGE